MVASSGDACGLVNYRDVEVLDWCPNGFRSEVSSGEVLEWNDSDMEDSETMDLCTIGLDGELNLVTPEREGLRKLAKGVTVDSGAAVCVIDPEEVPEYALEPSEGSRKGQLFAGCGTEKLKNLGQKKFPVMTVCGSMRGLCMQGAKVRKPLLAVSSACDKEQFVLFDNDGSFIADRKCPEAAEIRRLIKKIKSKIELRRENGVYKFDAWVVPPGFPGQGK